MRIRWDWAVVVSAFLVVLSRGAAQEVDVEPLQGVSLYKDALFFSKDGQWLREFQLRSLEGERHYRVRVVTYDARTGAVVHVVDLEKDSWFLSATTDARVALISFNGGVETARAYVVRLDVETGRQEEIPAQWFGGDHRPDGPYATISGDGRLIGAYSETGPPERPRVVTLYDWQTKKKIAQQSTGFPGGGFSWGDVTVDGKILFHSNRSGGKVVDPKTGHKLTFVNPQTYRSPDGAWDVDFPNPMFDEEQAATITDGMTGIVVDELEGSRGTYTYTLVRPWEEGAFCGTSGRFVAARAGTVEVFEIPSGKRIAAFPHVDAAASVACSADGKRVGIRSVARLTIHRLQ
jgi:hypothetical protein